MEEICYSLSTLLSQAGEGGYKIYYEDDLTEALPEDMRNRETLEAALKTLASGGYIDVKYARGSAFCIAHLKCYPLPQTPDPATDTAEIDIADVTRADTSSPSNKIIYAVCAACAFLGGAAGGLTIALLGAVI